MSTDKEKCWVKIQDAANYFRLGMEAQASDNLVVFIDSFLPLLQGGELRGAAGVENLLSELLQAQSRKDYVRVADILEYEIAEMVK